jgi:two-component system sensor histidine kinase PilS (NtrC family)
MQFVVRFSRMATADSTPEQVFGRRLWWLIVGRAAVAVAVMLAGAVWARGTFAANVGDSLQSIRPLLVVVTLLTLIYSAAHVLWKNYQIQAGFQFFADVLLVTWLVWITGGARSPYTALYIVVISVASWFIGPRGALITSIGSALAFNASSLLLLNGIASPRSIPAEESLASVIQTMGLADISFLIVGLLAAKLAERQLHTDVQLAAATRSLADLRALHERIVESIRSGLITTDLNGTIYTFNAAAEEITGYSSRDVRGQNATVFFGDLTRQVAESMAAAASGKVSPRFEIDSLTQSGFMLHLGYSIAPLFAESGETSGLVITFQDLTDVRVMEETARRQDRLAAVGRLAASIAHEIRNPLAAMRGSIQMLRSEMKEDSDQGQLMEIILRESDRLNKIVSDYLNYARPRPTELTDVDVCQLIKETLRLLRNSPEISDGHRLEEELPEEPLMVRGDAEQLKQVCWNVARNALNAMPDGGEFRVRAERTPADRVQLIFKDTGLGMSPEQVERLFEPFTSTTGGTGLGLSIVYQIIRDHSGTINVRSLEGKGTTITVELPGVAHP